MRWRSRWGIAGLLLALVQLGQAQSRTGVDSLRLLDVLPELARQSGYSFGYSEHGLAGVRIAPEHASTWTALSEHLEDYRLSALRVDEQRFLLARQVAEAPQSATRTCLLNVRDQGVPLQGATLLCSNGEGYVSNAEGVIRYQLSGDAAVAGLLRYVGYQPERFVDIAGLGDDYTMEMHRDTAALPAIEVRGLRPWSAVLEESSLERKSLLPALSGRRMEQTLTQAGFSGVAGLSSVDGRSAVPAVRGSHRTETLLNLADMPIYRVDHLYGAFTSVSPGAIDRLEVYRSHYPVEYGGYRGGMLDLTTKRPDTSFLQLKLNQLTAEGSSHLRVGNWRLLLAGRSSLGDVGDQVSTNLVRLAETATLSDRELPSRPVYQFWDGFAQSSVSLADDKLLLEASVFLTQDSFRNRVFGREISALADDPLQLQGVFNDRNLWDNQAMSVSARLRLTKGVLHARAYRSRYEYNSTVVSAFRQNTRDEEESQFRTRATLANVVNDRLVSIEYQPRKPWYAGLQYQRLESQSTYDVLGQLRVIELPDSTNLFHTYGGYKKVWSGNLTGEVNLRVTYNPATLDFLTLPYVKLRYQPDGEGKHASSQVVELAYSYRKQWLQNLQQENLFGQTLDVLVANPRGSYFGGGAHNFTLGHKRKVDDRWRYSVEAYYRTLQNILSNPTSFALQSSGDLGDTPRTVFDAVSGSGDVVGVDVDVAYQERWLTGTLAYTLSRSRQRFEDLDDGAFFPAPDDRRHRAALNLAADWKSWRLTLSNEYATGTVYTDADALLEVEDRLSADPAAYQRRLPNYNRLDLKLSYELPRPAFLATCSVQLINAFDRNNLSYRQYVVTNENNRIADDTQLIGTDLQLFGRMLLFEVGILF